MSAARDVEKMATVLQQRIIAARQHVGELLVERDALLHEMERAYGRRIEILLELDMAAVQVQRLQDRQDRLVRQLELVAGLR